MRRIAWTACAAAMLLAASAAPAGEFNPVLSIGDAAPAWTDLPGADGNKHSLADLKDKQVVVVVFTCNSCPYAVDYEDRLVAFAKEHGGKDSPVALVAINVNRIEEDSLEAMTQRAKDKGFTFPYVFDESQNIAREYGATYTPEFFVLDAQRKIAYMGAMDDNADAMKVKERYIADAVAAVLAGKQPEKKETPAVGCGIRYERTRRRPAS